MNKDWLPSDSEIDQYLAEVDAVVYCPICGNSTDITKGERIHFGIPRVIYCGSCSNRGINSICKVSYID